MTTGSLLEVINIITIAMMVGIIAVYGIAIYWNILFLINTKQPYGFNQIYFFTIFACACIVIVFSYLFLNAVTGNPIEISFFGGMIIRPCVFLIGASSAGTARARYTCHLLGKL